MKRFLFACLLAIFATAQAHAAPGDMSVATFLEKADRLESRGPLALLSSDFGVVKREIEASADAYKTRIDSDKDAGRAPHSCPPEAGGSLNSDELLAHFRSYPVAARSRTTVRRGFFDMMARRYPCD